MSRNAAWGWDGMTHSHMVDKMKKGWRSGSGTSCGYGSQLDQTHEIRSLLPKLVAEYDIHSIADVGAGDMNWMLPTFVDFYQGYDIFPRRAVVEKFDATAEVLPDRYDLILCRHVLNHISPKLALDALRNFKSSGSTWLLMTMSVAQGEYWMIHGLSYGSQAIATYQDCEGWILELFNLETVNFG